MLNKGTARISREMRHADHGEGNHWLICRRRRTTWATSDDEGELVHIVEHLLMSFQVQRQMIGTRKRARAELALEWLIPGVFAIVPSELVGSGKTPLAIWP